MFKNPQDIVVFMGSTHQASIECPIASHVFAFNPDEVKWSYTNNTVSRDTVGGRVVQLLSSKVEQMTVNGKAGSRGELQLIASNMKKIMEYQIATQSPVSFKVSSRKWNFKVYIQNISSLGWDYAATSYPYEITLLVQQDLSGLTGKTIEQQALQRLAEGIGYVDKFHSGDSEEALAISEAYRNSMGLIKSRSTNTIADAEAAFDAATINPGPFGNVIVQIARTQLGVPYVWAAEQEGVGFDCSGFTKWVYEKATGKQLPHKASEQQKLFIRVEKEGLSKGDLVFFWFENDRGIPRGSASHVGIYAGNGIMIDASSSKNAIVEREVIWSNNGEGFINGGRRPAGWDLLPQYKT